MGAAGGLRASKLRTKCRREDVVLEAGRGQVGCEGKMVCERVGGRRRRRLVPCSTRRLNMLRNNKNDFLDDNDDDGAWCGVGVSYKMHACLIPRIDAVLHMRKGPTRVRPSRRQTAKDARIVSTRPREWSASLGCARPMQARRSRRTVDSHRGLLRPSCALAIRRQSRGKSLASA